MNILERIVTEKKLSLLKKKLWISVPKLEKKITNLPTTKDFKKAISVKGRINLIAEIKKASPSQGMIRKNLDIVKTAKIYEESGAAAISVLTEEKFFKGLLNDLAKVKKVITIPVLRKDFIFDEYQVYESRAAGADAILLIAAILTKKQLQDLLNLSKELSLTVLVEVHNKQELDKVLNTSAEIIGINNRDLRVFEVDLRTTLKLKKYIPQNKIIVSESGIHTKKDIDLLKQAGINAVLIGQSLIQAEDIGKKIKELELKH